MFVLSITHEERIVFQDNLYFPGSLKTSFEIQINLALRACIFVSYEMSLVSGLKFLMRKQCVENYIHKTDVSKTMCIKL